MNYELLGLLVVLGAFVGVLAGLLGIGGGVVIVPALLYLLPYFGISADITMQIALGTSLATIIITSGSSAINHLALGNVDMFAIKWLMPGVLAGGFFGTFIAEWIPTELLPKIFAVIIFIIGVRMLLSIRNVQPAQMPTPTLTMCYGGGIGVISSLAGIGGGSLSVPFLNRHGVIMRKAVGSSSVCGCVIALAGMIGFMLQGYHVQNLPPYSIGYVYLPALFAIACTSVLTTKVGAKLATRISTPILKKVFAVFLMFVASTMLL
ncbi:hypothetical protein BCU68_06460 [Vibrio sp. 10N.286.49.B3]|uniref:sulfite exporter TauE/SafE family protein n=1 Tax=Vibrio sp. 10N.286.49.B3 TaxID=1880855 RepID=UPI000C8468E2|nr:sulfite exporter TauE/SafE family protein [Vibrio sp. 10N.286.49.B3]PMH39741.1 hypothetical protein BCU68_06460 [Vibrio sp. 10N.286.49.B3]